MPSDSSEPGYDSAHPPLSRRRADMVSTDAGAGFFSTVVEHSPDCIKILDDAGKIMIVEDSKDTADILAMFFEMEGREVEMAYDGEEAVRKVENSMPELILMDLGMPRMDGFEAARKIRALAGSDAVTLVALSGWGQPQDKERSRDAGFNEHLVKPVSPSDLRRLLQRLDAGRTTGPMAGQTDPG